jgi:hypothetical protein
VANQVTPSTICCSEPVKMMPQAWLSILYSARLNRCEESTPLPLDHEVIWLKGFGLPKALAESKTSFSFSSSIVLFQTRFVPF